MHTWRETIYDTVPPALVMLSALPLGVMLAMSGTARLAACALIAALLIVTSAQLRMAAAVWIPLLLVTVNAERLGTLIGVELVTLQKVAVVASWLLAGTVLGFRRQSSATWFVVLWTIVLGISVAAVTPIAGLSTRELIFAFAGFVLPALAFFVRWENAGGIDKVAKAVAWAPWISVALGYALSRVGMGPVFRSDFTGIDRLQGAVTPAHLAMLAVAATAANSLLLTRPTPGSFRWVATFATFGLCLATGTRAASVVCLALIALIFLRGTRSTGAALIRLVVAGGAITALVQIYLPLLEARSASREAGATLNTSGRTEAWQFWIDSAQQAPWIGQGLGASTQLIQARVADAELSNFVVPHNMYLQVWLDAGFLGGFLVAVAWLVLWRGAVRRSSERFFLVTLGLCLLGYSVVDNTFVTPQLVVPMAMLVAFLASRDEDEVRSRGTVVGAGDDLRRAGKIREAADGGSEPRSLSGFGAESADERVAGHL